MTFYPDPKFQVYCASTLGGNIDPTAELDLFVVTTILYGRRKPVAFMCANKEAKLDEDDMFEHLKDYGYCTDNPEFAFQVHRVEETWR